MRTLPIILLILLLACPFTGLAADHAAAATHISKGNALLDIKHYAEAVAEYDKALALEPDNAQALRMRSVANMALGKADQASADLRRALKLQDDCAKSPGKDSCSASGF